MEFFIIMAICLFYVFYIICFLRKVVLQWRSSSDRTFGYMLAYDCHKPSHHQKLDTHSSGQIIFREEFPTLSDPFSEVDEIIFATLDELFARMQVPPSQISMLLINRYIFEFTKLNSHIHLGNATYTKFIN